MSEPTLLDAEETRPVKNVYVSLMINGAAREADVINLALKCGTKGLYAERAQFDLEKTTNSEYGQLLIDGQILNEKEPGYKETHLFENPTEEIIQIKDQDYKIKIEIGEFLEDLSENGKYTLRFWVDNPLVWFYFIEIGFAFAGFAPTFPDYIDPYPMDLNTLTGILLGGKKGEELYPNAPSVVEYNSYGRVNFIQDMVESILHNLYMINQSKEGSTDK